MTKQLDLSEFYDMAIVPCAVGRFLATLSQDEQDVFTEACSHNDITTASLNRWLAKRGMKTTDRTVLTHRKTRCRCNG
jgi:hypothetical protein